MPLPSTLPKRPKTFKKAVTPIETLRNNPTNTVASSSFPRGHPTVVWDPNEQRLMEIQRELLARSMMPHGVTLSGATAPRSIMDSSLSNHPYYATTSAAQRMLNVERAAYYRIGSSKQ
mmetsp:Transcript_14387/g.26145  ORF Transcript_14387/g.26145 Transcript_14387/m.26145 type:complete len:118 (-) Transcript_14387:187-540(-)